MCKGYSFSSNDLLCNLCNQQTKQSEEASFPNVFLILDLNHFNLIKAFNRYANVFVYFIDAWKFTHIIHRVIGRIKAECKSFPDLPLRLASKLVNCPHNIIPRQIDPNAVDLVFVSDPITCRINLKPFKNAIKAYWSHDHIYPQTYYTQLLSTQIQEYDIIFCAHKSYLDIFQELGLKVHYLPFAYDPDIHRPMNIAEKYDLAFIGTITPQRAKVIKEIRKRLKNIRFFVGRAWQHDMVKVYNESKIVLNISRLSEINWRIFEVLGCKRFLLTNRSQEVEELFHDKEHLVMYDDIESLILNVKEYLQNPEERNIIASQGYEEAAKKHTIFHRAKEVLITAGVM